MTHESVAVLIIDDNPRASRQLAREADARGYGVRTAVSMEAAFALLAARPAEAILVDLAPGAERALDLLPDLTRLSRDAEVLVLSRERSVEAALEWVDPETFTLVPKGDVAQVFMALGRALERRRIVRQNRRLAWELQTINEIAAGIPRSLDLEGVLIGALQGLVRAMGVEAGSVRLRNEDTGAYVRSASVGPPAVEQLCKALEGWMPSDQVIARRTAVTIPDFAALPAAAGLPRPLALQSAMSAPLFAGSDLVGTLSLGAARPGRFDVADERLLSSIACQLVVAIQNVRLHATITRGKAEWEATFDAISDPIAVFNDRGELLRGNQALADHLGVPITALRHLTCEQTGFCAGDHEPGACACQPIGAAHERRRREVSLADGRIFSVTSFPVATAGQRASVVQVAKNVTEEIRTARRLQQMSRALAAMNDRLVTTLNQLKTMQAQLVQAEKLSAMGHLVAGVAHELNNPLTSVIGYAQLVEEELNSGPPARPLAEVAEDVRRIAQESDRAARIVRNLLAFARRQSTARAPQDVAQVCARTLALRAYEFGLQRIVLEAELPPDLPAVLADAGQLQQVLLNLVLNAEQAMRGAEVRQLRIAAHHDQASSAVALSISDTGHGIEAVHLSRVFDPFFTTRAVGEGTGLGLSICYGIVRDHGGTISVDSTPGAGTTFHVLLPARLPACETGSVLVAHADPGEREFIAAACTAWGYNTVPVATLGEMLVEIAAAHLVIVEAGLAAADPAGWERVCRTGSCPFVIISPSPDDPDVVRAGCAHRVAALVPPIDLRTLSGAIRACAVKECV